MSKESDEDGKNSGIMTGQPEDPPQVKAVIVHVPRITPRTLPGLANAQNKEAIDW